MEDDSNLAVMDAGRGLLTDREREELAREANTSYKYKTRSLFRRRLAQLEQDVQVLDEHHPDLLDELREAVCNPSDESHSS